VVDKQEVSVWSQLDEDGWIHLKIETDGVLIDYSVDLTFQGALGVADVISKKMGGLAWSIIEKMYEADEDDRRKIDKVIDQWVQSKWKDISDGQLNELDADLAIKEFKDRLNQNGIGLFLGDEE
jgi:hypothetical protein